MSSTSPSPHSISRAPITEPGIAAKHPPARESRVSFFLPALRGNVTAEPALSSLPGLFGECSHSPSPPDLAGKLQWGFTGAHLSEIQKQETEGGETEEQLPALLPQWVWGAPAKPSAKLWSIRMGHSPCPGPAALSGYLLWVLASLGADHLPPGGAVG